MRLAPLLVQVPCGFLQNLFEFSGILKFLIFLGNLKFFAKNTELVQPPGLEPGTL